MGHTVYLVTGTNKGIGKQLVKDLLARSETTVIATVRDPDSESAQSLNSLPAAQGNQLHVLQVDEEAGGKVGYSTVPERAAQVGVTHVDVVVANAGASTGFDSVLETDPDAARRCFEVNAVGPFRLLQASWPLLERAGGGKFVLMTSSTGSIGVLDDENFPSLAYGMSKAAANYLAKKASVEFRDKGLRVGIIHPGWVQTGLGQSLADAVGVKEPPMTAEDSSRQILKQVDKLSFETTHGKFINYDGRELPW